MLYVLLGIVGLFMMVVRLRRGDLRTTIARFLLTCAAIGFGDMIFNRVIPLYTFRTGLLQGLPDNSLGQLLADALFVPAMYSALIPIGRKWNWLAAASLVVPLVILETVFGRLGLFLYHGWSPWMTVVLFGTVLAVITWYSDHFQRDGYTPLHRVVVTGAAIDFQYHVWVLLSSNILQRWAVAAGLRPSLIGDQALTGVLFHGLPFMAVAFVTVISGWARSWVGPVAVALVMTLWLLGLQRMGLYRVHAGWSPVYDGVVLALMTWAAGRLDAWFAAQQDERAGALV